MLTLGLSSYVLEIPNNAYATLNRVGCFQSRVLQADWLILEINEKAAI